MKPPKFHLLFTRLPVFVLLFLLYNSVTLAQPAPTIFSPEGLYVRGTINENNNEGQTVGWPAPLPFEAWYFKNVCIVTRDAYMLSGRSNPKWTYIFWYDLQSPDGGHAFQQWGTPDVSPISITDQKVLPIEARLSNPLYYLVQYDTSKSWRESPPKLIDKTDKFSTVKVRHSPSRDHNTSGPEELIYKVSDGKVLGMSQFVTVGNPLKDSNTTGSILTYEVKPMYNNGDFPALPFTVEQKSTTKSSFSTIMKITKIPTSQTPTMIINYMTQGMKRLNPKSPPDQDSKSRSELQ